MTALVTVCGKPFLAVTRTLGIDGLCSNNVPSPFLFALYEHKTHNFSLGPHRLQIGDSDSRSVGSRGRGNDTTIDVEPEPEVLVDPEIDRYVIAVGGGVEAFNLKGANQEMVQITNPGKDAPEWACFTKA